MPILVNCGFVSTPDDGYDMAVRHKVKNLQRHWNIFYWRPAFPPHIWDAIFDRLSLHSVSNNLAADLEVGWVRTASEKIWHPPVYCRISKSGI
ncbi:hypothetical protein CQ052_17320 [Ochrobactrum sp. MYb15]|nr:hypothetical protein CQZ90_14880 [Ochrobactrum sp. MYb19]PRA54457.1 hypothetical protein CQ062_12690 [Ochrobactrum sp. MYb68]PRA64378.1 hypothetical protein CQ053_13405 [Ochrobactrum sp. MYb18]PRA75112.1 hypothetical protein CQ049_18280 [Brucella thiophenivorans]PRA89676.1 hypothetical protein CQ051_15320 [Ochrobactrum sp. MYb14]PRA96706.1 hypothetical protein CQ052_17320 [Ochrobactrum sp. MYb15]